MDFVPILKYFKMEMQTFCGRNGIRPLKGHIQNLTTISITVTLSSVDNTQRVCAVMAIA